MLLDGGELDTTRQYHFEEDFNPQQTSYGLDIFPDKKIHGLAILVNHSFRRELTFGQVWVKNPHHSEPNWEMMTCDTPTAELVCLSPMSSVGQHEKNQ